MATRLNKLRAFAFGALLGLGGVAASATFNLFQPASGILVGNPSSFITTAATSTNVINLWSGTCNGTTVLKGDGTCGAVGGSGTVTSVALTLPAWLSVSGSPITSSGTLAVTATSGQTQNQFLGTPNGSSGTVGLRSIVAADLPAISLTAGVSGILPVANGGTNTAFFNVSGPASTAKTYTFPNASATVLTTNAAVTVAQGGTGVATLTGIVLASGTSNFAAATSTNVISLWSGTCNSGTYLKGDGSCGAPAGSGTVTSVALTMPGVFSVGGSPITSTGTLAVTANGNSGGIPYFSASSTMASSAALTANQIVLGGGAGNSPTALSAGTSGQYLMSNGSSAPTWESPLDISDLPSSAGLAVGDLFLVYDLSDTQSQQATAAQVSSFVLGNAFTAFTGPTTSTKTFTLPNASSTILTSNAAVTVAQGGTGVATLTGILQGNGTGSITGITNSTTVGQTFRVTGSNTYAWGALDLADGDAITGILPTANGGTANAFFTVSGPSASAKTFTFPNASSTVLTSNAAVTVAQGGTGIASGTSGGVPYFSGTTTVASSGLLTQFAVMLGGGAAGAPNSVSGVGTSGQVLTSNGAGANPTWQAAGGGGISAYAVVTRATNQTIADATVTAVSFSTEDVDVGGFWTAGAPTRMTIPSTGVYTITASVGWGSGTAVEEQSVYLRLNGSTLLAGNGGPGFDFDTPEAVTVTLPLTAADYVEVTVIHNSTGTRALDVTGGLPRFSIFKIN